jgi:hypothetical protein
MLGELGLSATTLAADRASECSQTGIQFDVSDVMLFQCIWPLECFATVIAQVRTLIIVDVVHVADVVLLATRLV